MRWRPILITALVLTFAIGLQNPPKQSADVQPGNQHDIRVFGHNSDGDVTIGNNTQLCLSAQILTMGGSPEVLQPHVRAQAQMMTDPDVIGPQGSILRGLWESSKEYSQPHGRNAIVEIVTCGGPGYDLLTDSEKALHRALLERTVIDQVIIPFIVNGIGVPELKNRAKLNALRNLIKGLLSHNTKVLEDLKYEVYDKGSTKDAFWVVTNFLWREIENGGLAGDLLLDGLRISLKERFAVWLAKRKLMSIHPALRLVDWIHKVLDYGPDAIQIIKTFDDMRSTPAKLRYKVYFRTGVDDISPRFVRVGSVDHQFVVSGYHMFPVDGLIPMVSLSDRRGRPIYSAFPDWILPNGSQLQVTVPNSELRDAQWPLRATVTFGAEAMLVPGEIRLLQELEGITLSPPRAMSGQPIRVLGPAFNPYFLNSKVFFGDARKGNRTAAFIERIADGYIAITVPRLSETVKPKDWRVWVEEVHGNANKSSRLLPFELIPGDWNQEIDAMRDREMPEGTHESTGVLTPQDPIARHEYDVPSGMQVQVSFTSAYGTLDSRGSVIDGFTLYLVEQATDGSERSVRVSDTVNGVRGPQPVTKHMHTLGSGRGNARYFAEFKLGTGGPIEYKLKWETKRVDDAGSASDAAGVLADAMPIHAGVQYAGHLYGEKRLYKEDLFDCYRVPNVQRGQKIRLTLSDVQGDLPYAGALSSLRGVYIYHSSGPGNFQQVANWTEPVGNTSREVTLFHEDPLPGDYVVAFGNMAGNARYSFRVDVGYDFGPSLEQTPIATRFNQGSVEGWKIGPLGQTQLDALIAGVQGAGHATTTGQPDARKGPLDIVLVIDNTQSMSGVIGSVKDQARQIVQALAQNSGDLRVGLVSFSDIAADGVNARRLYPLSAEVQRQLDALAAWGLGSGGQDGPEDMLHGLRGAIEMEWRARGGGGHQVGKAIIVISDNPAKLTDGKDANGNTLASITSAAKAKGIQIYPVMMRSDPTFASHASILSKRTGGEVVDWSQQSQVVATLTSVAAQAVERSMPRYWIAPGRFHGNLSRFYGRALAFDTSGFEGAKGFDSDDVILEGGGLTLTLRSTVRPDGNPQSKTGWQTTVVPLSTVGYWTVQSTGQRPTTEQWMHVLSDVTAVMIRAEFYAGPDECTIDNVEFGSLKSTNDRGLSQAGIADAEWIRGTIEGIRARWSLYGHCLNVEETERWMYDWLATQGVPRDRYAANAHFQLLTAVRTPILESPKFHLLDEPIRELKRWLDRVRISGQLSPDDKQRLDQAIKEWNERMAAFDGVRRDLEFNIQRAALADYRRLSGPPEVREMNNGLFESHERATYDLKLRMRALAYKVGFQAP